MNLSIKIIDRKPKKIWGAPLVEGQIQIDDFYETFDMSLSWWTVKDYEQQWKEGLNRLETYSKSCLITRIQNPQKVAFVDWWLLYKEGNKIFIQNEVLFREYYDDVIGTKPFTLETCYNFIPPRETHTEDGEQVSEWIVEIKE